jgi:hypothetical protein
MLTTLPACRLPKLYVIIDLEFAQWRAFYMKQKIRDTYYASTLYTIKKKIEVLWLRWEKIFPRVGTQWFICCSFYLKHFILLTHLSWKTVSRQRHVKIYILDQRSVGLLGNPCIVLCLPLQTVKILSYTR